MPYFSIIIPTYNRSELIVRALNSIRAQTFTDYEVIIVDDGSTDNTEIIICNYIQQFGLSHQFRYLKKENGERAAARNFGTRHATGSFINWFDSDDLMDNNHLSIVFEFIQRLKTPHFIAAGYRLQDHTGTVSDQSNYPDNVDVVLYKGNFFACSPVFIQKDIASNYSFNEDRKLSGSEDYELWLRIAAENKVDCITQRTVTIVQHENRSVNTMADKNQLIERFTQFIRYTTSNHSVCSLLGTKTNLFVMKNYLLLAVELAANKHRKSSIVYLIKAGKSSWKILFQRTFYATMKHLLF